MKCVNGLTARKLRYRIMSSNESHCEFSKRKQTTRKINATLQSNTTFSIHICSISIDKIFTKLSSHKKKIEKLYFSVRKIFLHTPSILITKISYQNQHTNLPIKKPITETKPTQNTRVHLTPYPESH